MLRILLSLLALLLVPLPVAAQAVTHEPTATPPTERVTYIHTDALGSPILGTDAQGNVVWREDYQPYGERFLGDTAPSQRLYTGKYAETRSGLVDFGGRWYNPEIGRFYSVDPQGFDEANPHSFNRYAYANNNPYRYVDPDGESPVDLVFLAYDVGKLGVAVYTGQGVGSALLDAGSSVLGAASPIPGAGQAIKAARAVDKAADVAKGVNPKALIGRQGREEMSGSKVNRLAKDMKANGYDASHPIDAANVDGKLIILDGHHRAQAAAKAGVREVPVNVHNVNRQQADQLMREAAEARIGN